MNASRQPLRIVIADDESIIRMDLIETLTAAGFDVVGESSNGQVALDLIMNLSPDLAILDMKMPLLSGTDVASAVKDLTPVILLTAYTHPDVIDEAASSGVSGYVVKPFTEGELVAAINIAHSRFTERQELITERDGLADALETRKMIDRAKGLLQTSLSISEPDAFRWIQKAAMDRRLSVREVAQSVINEFSKEPSQP